MARSMTGAPSARVGHTAVWTGTEMLVWAGWDSTGARYNPATDLWVELPKPVPPVAGGFGVPARAVVSNGSIWLASTYLVPSTSTNTAVPSRTSANASAACSGATRS